MCFDCCEDCMEDPSECDYDVPDKCPIWIKCACITDDPRWEPEWREDR